MKKRRKLKISMGSLKSFYTLPRKYDFPLLFCCIALSLIGIVYIGSASMSTIFNNLSEIASSQEALSVMVSAIFKQALFLVISLAGMCFVANFYEWEWFRFPLSLEHFSKMKGEEKGHHVFMPLILMGIFAALLACLLFPARNGTHAWITVPGVGTIQPAEFAKVAMIMLVAGTFCRVRQKVTQFELIKPVFLVFVIYFFTIWQIQNDFGSAVILALVTVTCCLLPSDTRLSSTQKLVSRLLVLAAVVVVFILSPWGINLIEHVPFLSEYQVNRFITAIDPFYDRYGTGFQVSNSLIAFARGGLAGSGLGTSIQKFGYLPYADSDFIIAVIAEEGGLFMLSVVFLLYGLIIWRLIKYAIKMKKDENKVILIGTAVYLFTHVVFNIGGATAFIPLTGVPLLMLSSGGSSLLSWYLAVGLSQSVIARYRRGEE